MINENKKYLIEGGRPLNGSIPLSGAKNSANKQLVASLLTSEPVRFHGMPRTLEIDVVLNMLEQLGSKIEWQGPNELVIQTKNIPDDTVNEQYSGFNRIPILMLAPLLNRIGRARVPCVGGCFIGSRPVDFHLVGLTKMGASIEVDGASYLAKAERLNGIDITLEYPSVGATENLMMAACLAKGTSVIRNAAVEPEVIDTVLLLQKMGALITVDVDRKIVIEGVERLYGADHNVMPDRIEAASFAILAATTGGSINLEGAKQQDMVTFLNVFRRAGGGFETTPNGLRFFRRGQNLLPVNFETGVHPGFMTDWQQPFVALLTQAEGVSVVHETVYENRFGYTRDLVALGADIALSNDCLGPTPCRFRHRDFTHSCVIRGKTKYKAGEIAIPDLRAGFAYLTAALLAEGESVVSGIRYLERGHEHIPERLSALGAKVQVI